MPLFFKVSAVHLTSVSSSSIPYLLFTFCFPHSCILLNSRFSYVTYFCSPFIMRQFFRATWFVKYLCHEILSFAFMGELAGIQREIGFDRLFQNEINFFLFPLTKTKQVPVWALILWDQCSSISTNITLPLRVAFVTYSLGWQALVTPLLYKHFHWIPDFSICQFQWLKNQWYLSYFNECNHTQLPAHSPLPSSPSYLD